MGLAQTNTVVAAVGIKPATLGAGAALSGFLQTTGGGMGSAVNALFPAGDPLFLAVTFGGTAVLGAVIRSEEHTSELQSLMRISYAVFCLKKKNKLLKYINIINNQTNTNHKHII